MRGTKQAIFLLSFIGISIILLNFRAPKPQKSVQQPGWQEQYSTMKNLTEGVNYYGLRNSWNKFDKLNKKSSGILSFVTEMGPNNVAGRVRAILIDASDSLHLFAGGVSGGLWVSTNGGQNWTPVNDQNLSMAVTCITQNPFNPKEIYYGTGEKMNNNIGLDGAGVFKSIDGGKTFTQLPSTATLAPFASIWDIEYSKTDSSTFYVGTGNGGLYRTTNNGLTFKAVYTSSKSVHEIVTYKDSSIWFGLEGYGLITASEDSIMKFTRFTNTLPSSGIGRISMNYSEKFPNVAFCQILNTSGNALVGIYKTSNHGVTWKKLTSPSTTVYSWGWYCLNTNVSSIDTNYVIAISVQAMQSVNGGVSWNELAESHADFHTSMFYPSGRNLLIGNDGGVYRFNTKTALTSNTALNNGLNITQFYTGNYNPLNSSDCIGGSQDNGTHALNAFGFKKVFGGDGSYCAFSSAPPYYTYVSYQNGEIRRLNQYFTGETSIKPIGSYSYWFINPFKVNPLDGNQVYILSKRRILVSTNAGNNWAVLSNSLNKDVLSMGLSYQTNPTVYFGGSGTTLYRSTKASTTTLSEVDLTSTAPTLAKGSVINSIKVSQTNPNTVYISMSDINTKPRVWKLNNAESSAPTWINISGNLPASLPVNCIEVNPQDSNQIIAGTDFGLYTTADGGTTWSKEEAIPNVPIYKIVSHPKNGVIYIFTHGRGIFKSQFKEYVPTGSIAKQGVKPYEIHFNNPVETNLNITIGNARTAVDATLYLYNFEGKMVYGTTISETSSTNISHLTKGVYVMKLTIGQAVYNYKVLKL